MTELLAFFSGLAIGIIISVFCTKGLMRDYDRLILRLTEDTAAAKRKCVELQRILSIKELNHE